MSTSTASMKHARLHGLVFKWLDTKHPEYEWLIDLDVNVVGEEKSYVLRPDIVGVKAGVNEVFVEISYWTLSRDLNEKKEAYSDAAVPYYVVVDCKNEKIIKFTLDQESGAYLENDAIFPGLNEVFS